MPNWRATEAYAKPPSATITCKDSKAISSLRKNPRQEDTSAGVGLLAGGAHLTGAVMKASVNASPSSELVEEG